MPGEVLSQDKPEAGSVFTACSLRSPPGWSLCYHMTAFPLTELGACITGFLGSPRFKIRNLLWRKPRVPGSRHGLWREVGLWTPECE